MSRTLRLVDTNVLLYFCDTSDDERRAKARSLLVRLWAKSEAAVSVQGLSEFAANARKLTVPLSWEQTERRVSQFTRSCLVYSLEQSMVLEALRRVRTYQLSYWDAQLWAVAKLHGVSEIWTEDTPSALEIEGVRYINPFVQDFDLHAALRRSNDGASG